MVKEASAFGCPKTLVVVSLNPPPLEETDEPPLRNAEPFDVCIVEAS